MSSDVYFTKEINGNGLKKVFDALNKKLEGKVAIKVHSGEKGNQNFLPPSFWEEIIKNINGTVVECNTAYEGERNTTKKHLQLLKEHEWSKYYDVEILDSEEDDLELEIPNGVIIKKNYVGKALNKYDSLLVLSHFKGHPMGGFGGALKQLSIGCASSRGKAYIHSGGFTKDPNILWNNIAPQDDFVIAMSDAASSVAKLFNNRAIYINVMKNMSVDCDCCSVAEDPCMKDIGILASLDPIAIDQACIDLVYNAKDDPGQGHFLERINSRHGTLILDYADKLDFGTRKYNLINIDK